MSCRDVKFENNLQGSFVYGYTSDSLFSANMFPSVSIQSVRCNGILCSTNHSGVFSYALSENNESYTITELNNTNGIYQHYKFGELHSINNESFAINSKRAYFIFTDSVYSYIKSFGKDGTFLKNYTFNGNVRKLFINNSEVYALLYNGDIYKITDNGSQYCTHTESGLDIYNAGAGYVINSKKKLISLSRNEEATTLNADFNCIIKSENTLVYSNSKTIFYVCKNDYVYPINKNIKALFQYKNKVGILHDDFSYESIDISNFKIQSADNTPSADTSANDAAEILIKYADSGTTVSAFKKAYDSTLKVFDCNGNEVTNGKIKTGYTAKIENNFYYIAVLGDLTGEGNVKSNDVSRLMSYFTEKEILENIYLAAADYNRDGIVNNIDLVYISRQAEK